MDKFIREYGEYNQFTSLDKLPGKINSMIRERISKKGEKHV